VADKDQRHIDRAAEEARQAKVKEAVDAIDWEAFRENSQDKGPLQDEPAKKQAK